MNILILTWEYPPSPGGAGAFVRDLSVALCELKHSVTVITKNIVEDYGSEQHVNDNNLVELGIDVIRIPWPHPQGMFTVPYYLKKFLGVNRNQYDRFLITDSKAHAVASKVPMKLLQEYSLIVHGAELDRHFGKRSLLNFWFYRKIKVRKLFRNAVTILGISEDTVKRITEYGFQAKNISLGVDPSLFYPENNPEKIKEIRQDFGMRDDEFAIVTVSRLDKDKGQDMLIRAFANLANDFPDTTIWIAGDGEYRKELEEIAVISGFDKRINFLGRLSRNKVRELMQAGSLFALISRRKNENFGLVFIEANACCKTLVGGRTGGVSEAVEHGESGLLVNPNNIIEIEQSLRSLISNHELRKRLEKDGRKRFLKGFTHIHNANQILELSDNS